MKLLSILIVFCCCPVFGQVPIEGDLAQWANTGEVQLNTPAVSEHDGKVLWKPFRKGIVNASKKASQQGYIEYPDGSKVPFSKAEARRLRRAMISPAFRAAAKELASLQARASGEAVPTSGGEVDFSETGFWSDFFLFILPLLLELLRDIQSGASP